MKTEILKETGSVIASSYRIGAVDVLTGGMATPTRIARGSGIRTNHISKVLSELKTLGLVVCINPEVRKGKLYCLTPKGAKVAENLKVMGYL